MSTQSADVDPARQPTEAEMTELQQQELRKQVNEFMRDHSAFGIEEVKGIMRWRDNVGNPQKPLPHQVVAANKLLAQDQTYAVKATKDKVVTHAAGDYKEFNKRKASLLAVHEVGTGKTLVGILALAGVFRLAHLAKKHEGKDDEEPKKAMIIVPKSVLIAWHRTLLAWTDLADNSGVLLLTDHKWFDKHVDNEKTFDRAQVVVTTPDVIKGALKTCFNRPDKTLADHEPLAPKMVRRTNSNNEKEPLHPLLKFIMLEADKGTHHKQSPYAITIVDEAHLNMKPKTWKCCAISIFTQQSQYKLALTGTPIKKGIDEIGYLAMMLDVRMQDVQDKLNGVKNRKKQMHKRGYFQKDSLNVEIDVDRLNDFRTRFMDRVTTAHLYPPLPAKKETFLYYDPFIGLDDATGEIDQAVIADHNEQLALARDDIDTKQKDYVPPLVEASSTDSVSTAGEEEEEVAEPVAPEDKKWNKLQKASFFLISKLGNYEFSSVLGREGAKAFNKRTTLYEEAAGLPSQTMLLIERVVRDRQQKGHVRVAVFAESVVQLKILQRHFEAKDLGDLFLFDSKLDEKQRDQVVSDFLACAKGVMFLSKAGGIGINLQAGCEVMLSVGSLPWNATDVDQAWGRIYRYKQTRPVELIQFIARRSVTYAKYSLHGDKRDRLEASFRDNDYTAFADDTTAWRWTKVTLSYVAPLDPATGNYKVSDAYMARVRNGEEPNHIDVPLLPSVMPLPPALPVDA